MGVNEQVGNGAAQSAQGLCLRTAELAAERGVIEPEDRTWAYNTLLSAVGEDGCAPAPARQEGAAAPAGGQNTAEPQLEDLFAELAQVAKARGRAPIAGDGDLGTAAWLAGLVMPRPSQVAQMFYERYARSPKAATDWFYALSCDAGYVQRRAIARNVKWVSDTRWGDLEITINLSKPEKDPRAIAAAGRARTEGAYPACALCMENEGYAGRPEGSPAGASAARQNLRIVPLELGGERWGLQYSPYAYFSEHCIVMSAEHRPMHVDRGTFARLLEFTGRFPQYFLGSNADLPIVGGSILSHDHFQGGRHTFPMQKAPIAKMLSIEGFPDVRAGLVRWPLTVLRLISKDAAALAECADHVLSVWRAWSDPAVGIVAEDDAGPHNTVTPIARCRGGEYTLDLALRCNVTSAEHPLGVFHPHEDLHHIKKENIGLIEVMGLAILPPRLARELGPVEQALVEGAEPTEQRCGAHAEWVRDIQRRRGRVPREQAGKVVCDEVAQVFARVLEDAGVFKWDAAGRAALNRFLDAL